MDWDIFVKAVTAVFTVVILPAVGWAVRVQSKLNRLEDQVGHVSAQIQEEREERDELLSEIRAVRNDLRGLSDAVLQRMTRVETKLGIK